MNAINFFKTGSFVFLLVTVSSCSSSHYKEERENNTVSALKAPPPPSNSLPPSSNGSLHATDSLTPSNMFISSSAAGTNSDTNRKFIKTADMKFSVHNVYKATYSIEDIVKKFDGFVTYTNLNSSVNNKAITNISADSSLESTYYTVSNTMVLRVPCNKLDTTLRTIARLINFLDDRIIKADDVQFDILSNQLTELRARKHAHKLSNDIDTKGKKLIEISETATIVDDKEEQADNARVENLKLKDRIQYSTINIEIYQRETIKRELIANEKNIKAYEPGLGFKIWEAIKSGWSTLEDIIVFLANIWFLYVIAILGYLLYRFLVRIQTRNKPK